jgi:hypothetical protein
MEPGQTIQWQKEKEQTYLQNTTQKTKDWAKRISQKNRGELRKGKWFLLY